MEGLSADEAVIRMIKEISQQWMTDMFHMNPDLVSPSCFQFQGNEGALLFLVLVYRLIVGTGVFAVQFIHTPFDGGASPHGQWEQ